MPKNAPAFTFLDSVSWPKNIRLFSLSRQSRNQKEKIENLKSQYRNPKQIPNPKFEIEIQNGLVWNIGILSLCACLGFRASDLGFLLTSWFKQFSWQFRHSFFCKG